MYTKNFPDLGLKITNKKSILKNFINYKNLLNNLKNKSISDTWIILGAGPSLELFQKNHKFSELLEKYPVVSIKQAGLAYPEVTNIQIFNEVRYNPEYSQIGNYRLVLSIYRR